MYTEQPRWWTAAGGPTGLTPAYIDAVRNAIASYRTVLGDMDGDGDVDNFDSQPFKLALTDRATYEATYSLLDAEERGDIDSDGDFDNFDIQPFEAPLAGGSMAAAVPEPSAICLMGITAVGLIFARSRRGHPVAFSRSISPRP